MSEHARRVGVSIGLMLSFGTAAAWAVPPTPATGLLVKITETGKITVSADGAGTNDASASIRVDKPNAAATVRRAFLACGSNGGRVINDGEVSLDGQPITWQDSVQNDAGAQLAFFNSVFAEVTSIVKPKADAAAAGLVAFSLTEVATFTIDGCALYGIFDDASQPTDNTVVLLFGGLKTTGDRFNVTLSEPLVAGDTAQMGLAISFGFQQGGPASHVCGTDSPQFSTLDVNGTRISSCAGSADDAQGVVDDGSLITVGGIGDNPANPANPLQQAADGTLPRIDEDEIYDLIPLLGPNDTLVTIDTRNPSADDNIFAGHFFLTTPAVVGEGILLAPATSQGAVGSSHTLTATVVDDNGGPVVGRTVTFTVASGPNAGVTGQSVTDAAGLALFTYVGSGGAGIDTIQATFVDSQGDTQTSNLVTQEWTAATGGETTLCSALKRHGWRGDIDAFEFQGTAGEEVSLVLEESPDRRNSGHRAILALVDATSGIHVLGLDKGNLPNQTSAVLPATGRYFAVVSQPRPLLPHEAAHQHGHRCHHFSGFNGHYCLTLRSSGNAFTTLKPTVFVEP